MGAQVVINPTRNVGLEPTYCIVMASIPYSQEQLAQ